MDIFLVSVVLHFYVSMRGTITILTNIFLELSNSCLSYNLSSGSEITPCNKIDKPLVVLRFSEIL